MSGTPTYCVTSTMTCHYCVGWRLLWLNPQMMEISYALWMGGCNGIIQKAWAWTPSLESAKWLYIKEPICRFLSERRRWKAPSDFTLMNPSVDFWTVLAATTTIFLFLTKLSIFSSGWRGISSGWRGFSIRPYFYILLMFFSCITYFTLGAKQPAFNESTSLLSIMMVV